MSEKYIVICRVSNGTESFEHTVYVRVYGISGARAKEKAVAKASRRFKGYGVRVLTWERV